VSRRQGLPERLAPSVHAELDRLGAGSGGAALAALLARWPEAVGETIARNAWPARRTRDGTVVVHTSSAAWAQELTHLEPEVRARLGDDAPALRFVVGPLPEPGPEPVPEARRSAHRPTALEFEQASAIVAAIESESVREIVREACARSLAAQRPARTDRRI